MEMKRFRIANSNILEINISLEIANMLNIDISLKCEKSNNREFS